MFVKDVYLYIKQVRFRQPIHWPAVSYDSKLLRVATDNYNVNNVSKVESRWQSWWTWRKKKFYYKHQNNWSLSLLICSKVQVIMFQISCIQSTNCKMYSLISEPTHLLVQVRNLLQTPSQTYLYLFKIHRAHVLYIISYISFYF